MSGSCAFSMNPLSCFSTGLLIFFSWLLRFAFVCGLWCKYFSFDFTYNISFHEIIFKLLHSKFFTLPAKCFFWLSAKVRKSSTYNHSFIIEKFFYVLWCFFFRVLFHKNNFLTLSNCHLETLKVFLSEIFVQLE